MITFKDFIAETTNTNHAKYKVGFTWDSPDGKNEIIKILPDGKFGVKKANQSPNMYDIETADDIDFLIKRDAANIEFHKKQAEKDKIKQQEIEKARNLFGFLDSYSKLEQGKIQKALLDKQVSLNGKFWRNRRDAIQYMINVEKRTINKTPNGERLETPEGYFFDQSDITKYGMEYAKYLIANKINTKD